MKRHLWVIGWLLIALVAQAEVYHLEKVNYLTHNAQYVLVRKNRALSTVIADNALKTDTLFPTTGLTGDEAYVWTIDKSGDYYVLKNGSSRLVKNSSNYGFHWSLGEEPGSRFEVDVREIDSMVSFKWKDELKYICETSTNSRQYKLGDWQNRYTLYRLIPDAYKRQTTIGQLGTICLPYAVNQVTGAEVYQISYLEKDQQGEPVNLYYEQTDLPLQAGRPYLFVPTAEQVVFQRASIDSVVAPEYFSDGFYGTFTKIQDGSAGASGNVLEGKYMVYNNTFQKCGGNCSLNPNRAYIDMTQVSTTPPAQSAQKRRLSISSKGVTYYDPTMIEEMRSEKQATRSEKRLVDGRLVIVQEGKAFSVLGYRR